MQHKLRLIVTDHSPGLQAAKRAPMTKGINRLQYAGLAAAVGPHQEVKPRRRRQIGSFDIAEIFNQ
ncbi:hypothetical protein D3C79_873820 [compost metagenome]